MSYREIEITLFFFFLRFQEQNMSYREIEIILFFSDTQNKRLTVTHPSSNTLICCLTSTLTDIERNHYATQPPTKLIWN